MNKERFGLMRRHSKRQRRGADSPGFVGIGRGRTDGRDVKVFNYSKKERLMYPAYSKQYRKATEKAINEFLGKFKKNEPPTDSLLLTDFFSDTHASAILGVNRESPHRQKGGGHEGETDFFTNKDRVIMRLNGGSTNVEIIAFSSDDWQNYLEQIQSI